MPLDLLRSRRRNDQDEIRGGKVVTRKAFENPPLGIVGVYGLQHLEESTLIWKVEGSTDLLSLFDAIPEKFRNRHVVLTNTCGAKEKPIPETVEPFRGKIVYVVPDADDAGEKGGREWAEAIATVAKETRLLSLPFDGLDGKKDLRDFLQSGGTYAQLLELADAAPIIKPTTTTDTTYDNRPLSISGSDLLETFGPDLLHGSPPLSWPVDKDPKSPLNWIEFQPHRVLVAGGPPGVGKTAFFLQTTFGALTLDPTLKVLIANVEMTPNALYERLVSHISGVSISDVMRRQRSGRTPEKLAYGLNEMKKVVDRLFFALPGFSIERIEQAANAHQADLIIIDYVQRIKIESEAGRHFQAKERIGEIMDRCRFLADQGRCVVVVSALTRPSGQKGKPDYTDIGIASLRDSSELEFGADQVLLLAEFDKNDPEHAQKRNLICPKHRSGQKFTVPLWFDGSLQYFLPVAPKEDSKEPAAVDGRAAACGERDDKTDTQGTLCDDF